MTHSIDLSDTHYRLIEAPDAEAAVACVQHFDYPSYTFITEDLYATREEAVTAARKLKDPRETLADIIYLQPQECSTLQSGGELRGLPGAPLRANIISQNTQWSAASGPAIVGP